MKKIFITGIIIICAVCGSYADVIPEGHHVVGRSIIVENCNDYPDYVLVGYITGPMISEYELFIVEQSVPIQKGYKFNDITLYAIHQEVVDAVGGVEYVDYDYLTQVISPVEIIDPAGFIVVDDNPLAMERITYTIWGVKDGSLILYISERRLEFNDGSPDEVEYFTYTP
jgi:hypothetical protein